MTLSQCGAVLLAASLLSGCSDGMRSRVSGWVEQGKALFVSQEQSPPLQELLRQLTTLEAIGMNLAYVEKKAGPAIRSYNHQHHFKIQGCQLVLSSDEDNKAIESVQVAVTPSCDIDVSRLLGLHKHQTLSTLTFEVFDEATVSGQYLADCLKDCGNGGAPNIYLIAQGSRALQFDEAMLTVSTASDSALEAADQWSQAMLTNESEDWVIRDQAFNCDTHSYRDAAGKALHKLKPNFFSFGQNLQYPKCSSEAPETPTVAMLSKATDAVAVVVPSPAQGCDMEYGKRLKAAGLQGKEITVHGPIDPDFSEYGCAYRITPAPGNQVSQDTSVTYRTAWEGG